MWVTETHRFMDDRAVVRFGEWLGDKIEYEFEFDGEVIFASSDFRPSPMREANGREAALDLLVFLTLQPGDTDREYFDKYTRRQWAWADSWECEQLGFYVSDEESTNQD